jgi:hypothetical protein
MAEWDTPSRHAELVAVKQTLVVRIPWGEDPNGLSLVDLDGIVVQSQACQAAE